VASPLPPDDARPDEFAVNLESDGVTNVEATVTSPAAALYPQPHRAFPCTPEVSSLLVDIAVLVAKARSLASGVIRAPALPYFPTCWRTAMESSRQYQIPLTPRVISPSPTPSEAGSAKDGYFGPVTRSSTRKAKQPNGVQSPPPIHEDSSSSDPELKRARTKSRSPITGAGRRRMSGLTSRRQAKKDLSLTPSKNGTVSNGHLSPAQANKNYWREMSRSPSPLGLIPIHQKWRSFVCFPHLSPTARILTRFSRSTNTKSRVRSSTYPSAS
jgi:diacylglycerol kinase (CTP)